MPRGIARTEKGRLNSREAKTLARAIMEAHPDLDARPISVAQGLAVVELRRRTQPYDLVSRVRSQEDALSRGWIKEATHDLD